MGSQYMTLYNATSSRCLLSWCLTLRSFISALASSLLVLGGYPTDIVQESPFSIAIQSAVLVVYTSFYVYVSVKALLHNPREAFCNILKVEYYRRL